VVDPFAEESNDFDVDEDALDRATGQADAIHIRIQQRNGRKTLTTIQGLPKEFDSKKVLKIFKKEFACNGSMIEDPEHGQIIQLQGDQRNNIRQLLVEEGVGEDFQFSLMIHSKLTIMRS